MNKLESQARDAPAMGKGDLAREALPRREQASFRAHGVNAQEPQLADEQEMMVNAAKRLQVKVDAVHPTNRLAPRGLAHRWAATSDGVGSGRMFSAGDRSLPGNRGMT